MEEVKFPRSILLAETLRQLGFSQPTYTIQNAETAEIRAAVHFSYPGEATNLNPKHIYCFPSDPCFSSIEAAQNEAAEFALMHLDRKMSLRILDHSYRVMADINDHNELLSKQIKKMILVIDLYLPPCLIMASEFKEKGYLLESALLHHGKPNTSGPHGETADTVLQQLKSASRKLRAMGKSIFNQISDIHAMITGQDIETLLPHSTLSNAGVNAIPPVFIHPTALLQHMLEARGTPPATYRHINYSETEIVSCCSFYPSVHAFRNSTPAVTSSSPAFTVQAADDDAATKSITSIQTWQHVRLNDFNYYQKESAIDTNRSLFRKATMISNAIKKASNEWNVAIEKATDILEQLKTIVASQAPQVFEQRHPLIASVTTFEEEINQVIAKGLEDVQKYDYSAHHVISW